MNLGTSIQFNFAKNNKKSFILYNKNHYRLYLYYNFFYNFIMHTFRVEEIHSWVCWLFFEDVVKLLTSFFFFIRLNVFPFSLATDYKIISFAEHPHINKDTSKCLTIFDRLTFPSSKDFCQLSMLQKKKFQAN